MKNKKKIISDFVNQILILACSGFLLIWLFRNRASLANLGPLAVVRIGLWFALVLYLLILIDTIRGFSSSYLFRRFDPADPASLEELAKIKRYQAFSPSRGGTDGEAILIRYLKDFETRGFREVARQSFGIVLEKNQGKQGERFIVIYKPMLNVIIADRHLKEASEYILHAKKRMRRNAIMLISDMDSDSEILSSAVCAVNFVPKISSNTIFVPYVLDLMHGRLFYPQDHSGLSVSDSFYYRDQRNDMVQLAARPISRKITDV